MVDVGTFWPTRSRNRHTKTLLAIPGGVIDVELSVVLRQLRRPVTAERPGRGGLKYIRGQLPVDEVSGAKQREDRRPFRSRRSGPELDSNADDGRVRMVAGYHRISIAKWLRGFEGRNYDRNCQEEMLKSIRLPHGSIGQRCCYPGVNLSPKEAAQDKPVSKSVHRNLK